MKFRIKQSAFNMVLDPIPDKLKYSKKIRNSPNFLNKCSVARPFE